MLLFTVARRLNQRAAAATLTFTLTLNLDEAKRVVAMLGGFRAGLGCYSVFSPLADALVAAGEADDDYLVVDDNGDHLSKLPGIVKRSDR